MSTKAPAAMQGAISATRRKKMSPLVRREAMWGFGFIGIWIVGFLGFTLLPTLATLIFSFTNLRLDTTVARFVGLQNYQTAIADPQLWASLWVTIHYGLYALPIAILMPLLLAVLMNQKAIFGKSFLRAGFYFPYIIPFVASVLVWGLMLNPSAGWMNQFLRWVGVVSPPDWLQSPTWIYPALVLIGIWGIGNAMLINLASLQGVPTELYDAAKIDGAGPVRSFINVTLPMISPVIFYNLILSVVGLFQYFLVPLVMNQGTGAPAGKTMFYNLYLYKTFFSFQNMSYGATQAWILFIIVLATTGLLFWSSRFWVYYAGGENN